MNEITIFNNEKFGEVRTVELNGEAWFVGKDIASALKYKDTADAIKNHVEEDDKMGGYNTDPCIIDSLGRKQYPIFINESGLYSLILARLLLVRVWRIQ